jgi:hypothetical protein
LQPGGSAETDCAQDSSISVYICMTLNWNSASSRGGQYVQLLSVQVSATLLAPGVRVTGLAIGAGELGPCMSGCSAWDEEVTLRDVRYPGYGRPYTGVPPWAAYFTAVGGPDRNCGTSEVTVQRGTGGDRWGVPYELCV